LWGVVGLVRCPDACERYYSAFQFVAWAGAGAHEALETAMFETAGEA
jgi:hypothetical protein